MCIVIDTNCFSAVFSRTSANHSEFEPVLNWIVSGHGKAVYGGAKYKKELTTAQKYLKIFRLLKQNNRVIDVNDNEVDIEEIRVKSIIANADFDDPHLAAIIIVSRCKLICSLDTRSVKYVTDRSLYNKGVSAPKYYTGLHTVSLLCDEYIPKLYRPNTANHPNVAKQILGVLNSIP